MNKRLLCRVPEGFDPKEGSFSEIKFFMGDYTEVGFNSKDDLLQMIKPMGLLAFGDKLPVSDQEVTFNGLYTVGG